MAKRPLINLKLTDINLPSKKQLILELQGEGQKTKVLETRGEQSNHHLETVSLLTYKLSLTFATQKYKLGEYI